LTGYSFVFLAILPYQNPEATSATAQPAVKYIKNGDGSMYHAATAAPAESVPQR
jgi:hypothetical protein